MRISPSRRLWFFFIALAGTHWAAGYGGFPDGLRQGIWLAGVAALWVIHSRTHPGNAGEDAWEGEVPGWAFWLLGIVTLLFRWGRLAPPGAWPCGDEFLTAQSADHLARHWDGRFFYSLGQSAPLLNWFSAVLLKAGASPAPALWLPPALSSATLPPLAYLAARTFLPPVPSYFIAFLAAGGYWQAMAGTFALQESLLLPWACLLFIGLGAYQKTRGAKERRKRAFLLGLAAGLGYWTYTPWWVVTLAAAALFLKSTGNQKGEGRRDRLAAGAAFLAALLPYLWACLKSGGGYQFLAFSVFDKGWISGKDRVLASLDYLNIPFWGSWSRPEGPLDPQGRGLLNPVAAALAFLGLFEMGAARSSRMRLSVAGAALLFLAPGLLSRNLQPFRINQFLLLLWLAAAWGLWRLASTLKSPKARWALALGILGLCAALDGLRTGTAYGRMAAASRPYRQAYLAVAAASKEMGRGLLFTQFVPDPVQAEGSLGPMLSSLNLARPGAPWTRARWGGLVVNEYYRPFLEKELTGVQWAPLCRDPVAGPGRLVLGLFPLLERQKARMAGWIRAQNWLEPEGVEMNNITTAGQYEETLGRLLHPPADFRRDRFLASVYGEWLSDFYYRFGFQGHYADQVDSLRTALRTGVPALHLYYQLGSLYLRKGNFGEARKAFQSALRGQPGNADVLSALSLLSEMEKRNRSRSR